MAVQYKIKGKETEFILDLPKYMDHRTKDTIERTLKKCVKERDQEKVMNIINQLISQTNAIVKKLKKDGNYHEDLEKDIRKFVGIHTHKGFEIGRKVIQPEEIGLVSKAMEEEMEYEGEVIEDLPKEIQDIATYIFANLELGRMAFETGFTLGILLSTKEVDKFYRTEASDIEYIR